MKKFSFLILVLLFAGFARAQINDVLVEFCTGTWCQYCPCGDAVVEGLLMNHPNTLVLAYHGPTNYGDPFADFNGNNIIPLFGFNSYPTGIVGRRTGIIDRSSWSGNVNAQGYNYPSPLDIRFIKTMDSVARTVNLTVQATALRDIDTNVYVNFVITEDNVIYSQTGNSGAGCIGGSNYVHKWIVRNMVNGATGEALSTGHWASGTVKTKSWSTTLPSGWVWYNCNANAFAYFYQGSLTSYSSYVLQTKKMNVTVITGVENQGSPLPVNYILNQNYPNPFNPVTNIHFSIPKDGNVTLKVYDILGNEVASLYNGYLKAGYYNTEFDGSKLSSGIYFYRLTAGSFSETKKMILSK
jgi:hypothetical protein